MLFGSLRRFLMVMPPMSPPASHFPLYHFPRFNKSISKDSDSRFSASWSWLQVISSPFKLVSFIFWIRLSLFFRRKRFWSSFLRFLLSLESTLVPSADSPMKRDSNSAADARRAISWRQKTERCGEEEEEVKEEITKLWGQQKIVAFDFLKITEGSVKIHVRVANLSLNTE